MSSAFVDLRTAFALLTVLPVGSLPGSASSRQGSVAWFAVVGVVLGILTAGVLAACSSLGFVLTGGAIIPPLSPILAPLVIAAWAIATRLLHWDGLADVADALGGSSTHERRLEILKDTHVGAFGAAAMVIVGLIQLASLTTILENASLVGWSLVMVPALGRLSATFAAWLGRPARGDGLGASIMGRPRLRDVLICGASVAALIGVPAALFGGAATLLAAIGVGSALVIPHMVSLGFGGVTGDVMGASVMLTETVCLVCAAALGVL